MYSMVPGHAVFEHPLNVVLVRDEKDPISISVSSKITDERKHFK